MQADRIRVYAWELPVRWSHWLNVYCMIAFFITGFYIGRPFIHAVHTTGYIMGWMRFLHFVAGYVFLFSMIMRIYWMFVGNRYASWRVLFPLTARQREDALESVKFYLFLTKKPPYAVGHSALAAMLYLCMFLLFFFEIFSGFALYSQSHLSSVFMTLLGGWLLWIMDVQTIRLWHHLVMYVLMALIAVHIYVAWYLDSVEKNGVMGSIFGGYKFVTGKEWE
jgi:Ni/Fe-hydrogenase 1 B-type cytochrome subunit